jgi:hypothetical protein
LGVRGQWRPSTNKVVNRRLSTAAQVSTAFVNRQPVDAGDHLESDCAINQSNRYSRDPDANLAFAELAEEIAPVEASVVSEVENLLLPVDNEETTVASITSSTCNRCR